MFTPKTVTCDFCNVHLAVLYCRADSAKLCLVCDQIVHAANSLSSKHVRSQICDNCFEQPVSVRCDTDNLVLCQDCDWDAHAVKASHARNPVEGFTGVPKAVEIASWWGLDLEGEKLTPMQSERSQTWDDGFLDSWLLRDVSPSVLLQDLMVPNENDEFSSYKTSSKYDEGVGTRLIPRCGKQKQVILKQLEMVLERDLMNYNKGIEPETPSGGREGSRSDGANGAVSEQPSFAIQQKQRENGPFSSLVGMHNAKRNSGCNESDKLNEGNMSWSSASSDPGGTQVLLSNYISKR